MHIFSLGFSFVVFFIILAIIFLVFYTYGKLSGPSSSCFCTYSFQFFTLNWKNIWTSMLFFIHVFIPLKSYLHVSDKISNTFVRFFLFFAETDDA